MLLAVVVVSVTALLALLLVARRRPDLVPERIRGWVARLPGDSSTDTSPTATSHSDTQYPLNEAGKPASSFGNGFEPSQ